ncbi:protein-tyrosine phosphatase family protein [Kocuria atrinae]|uniref:protein-tyrosine phosphatase family protein n=1 Tax=Kocuria atrinae TaxID=592377 RepID=UPI0002EE6AA8|nr:protein-tyrosine phosphatase family protein [Kocuria atrinae]
MYLLGKDPRIETWPNRWVKWPEFRTPAHTLDALAALREAHERALTERVEIACGGGVGRTGTAIALLAVMSGVAADDALAWVRAHYHPRAVETRGQKRWLRDAARSVHSG